MALIIQHIDSIEDVLTAHLSGSKKVLLNAQQTGNAITQIAVGNLKAGEKVEEHTHATMNEYFYFLKGKGEYLINGQSYELTKGTFVLIPAKAKHALSNTGEDDLEFFYFGVAID